MRCAQKQNERGNTQIFLVFFIGLIMSIGSYSLWKVGIEGGNTFVVTANSNKEHIAAVVDADILKAREAKRKNADAEQKKGVIEKKAYRNNVRKNIHAEANALQALRSAQIALSSTLIEAQQILSDTLHTQQAEQRRTSIAGPWDNFWWRGDMPGDNDPTPGVNKMYFAPIQGIGGGGGSSPAPAAPPPSSGGGGSMGGGAPSGGPPSGPPGAGTL